MATTTRKPAAKPATKPAAKAAPRRTTKPASRPAAKAPAASAYKYFAYTGTYRTKEAALKALDAVKALHKEKSFTSYEASVFERLPDGKVKMIKTLDPVVLKGAGWGLLAGGLIGLVFPPAGLAAAGLSGAAVGAVTGEFMKAFGRSTIKGMGDKLDKGKFGAVVVAKALPKVTSAQVLPGAKDATKKEITNSKEVAKQLRAQEKAAKDAEKAKAATAAKKPAARRTTKPAAKAAAKPAARSTTSKPAAKTTTSKPASRSTASKPTSRSTASRKPASRSTRAKTTSK